MRKLAIVAAFLAATFFSGSAFALTAGSTIGVRAPNGAVNVSYCHRHHYHHRGCCTILRSCCTCGCGCGLFGGWF
ncbi:MAG: hypothetical protein WBX25_00220 [Rhodomicrobium sp.]